MSASLDFIVT